MSNTLVFVKFEKVTVEIELSCFFFVKYSFTARHGTARIVITAVPKARFPTLVCMVGIAAGIRHSKFKFSDLEMK